jgi:hypothetical protein
MSVARGDHGPGASAPARIALACTFVVIASARGAAQDVPAPQPPPAGQPAIGSQPSPQNPPQPDAADAGATIDAPAAAPVPADEATPASPAAPAPPAPTTAEAEGVVQAPGTSLFEQSAAEPAPPTPEQGTAATGSEAPAFELGGYLRSDVFVGKVPGFSQGIIQAGYGELALKLDVHDARYGDAFAEARFRYGQQGDTLDLIVDLREAYVDAHAGPVDVRLGQQIIVWGRADAFNPTNNLTPFDLRIRSPIEDDRRIGNVGARAFVDLAPVRIEGVWLPLYVAAHYPPIVLDEFIALAEPDFPAPELSNGLGAVRVHLELAAFELSASFLHGHAPLPGFALRDFTVGEDPPEVRVSRTAYKQHVAGFDFSTAIGDVLAVRAEAAYRHPVDYEAHVHAPRPDVQYVLGVDRAFGPVNVIVQYMGRYVLDWQREDGPELPVEPAALVRFMAPLPRSLERRITTSMEEQLAARNQVLFSQVERVQHMATARVEWITLHETLSLSALGMLNFTTEEWLLFPKIGYRISDAMTTYLGAEVYVGPDGTLIDLIDERLSAVYAELRLSF